LVGIISLAIRACTATVDDTCTAGAPTSVATAQDKGVQAYLASIVTVADLAVADGAVNAGIGDRIQGEAYLAGTANTSILVAIAAILRTRGVAKAIINIDSISGVTSCAQTARIASLAVSDSANNAGIIVDISVEIVASLANIGSRTQ
jgi:pectin methylesterase-like acyl-CoA thioesterase